MFAKITEDQLKYTKYKWEFLRRNDDYKRDCEAIRDALDRFCQDQGIDLSNYPAWATEPYADVEPFTREELRTIKEIREAHKESDRRTGLMVEKEKPLLRPFCLKWHIKAPMNPQISYDEIVQLLVEIGWEEENIHSTLYDLMTLSDNHPVIMGELMFTSGVWIGLSDFILTHLLITICHNPEDIGNALDEGKLPIMINLNFSKRRIMQELEILVSHWKVKHKHWAGGFSLRSDEHFSIKKAKKRQEKWLNDRKKYSPTYHYDNYDDYLRVWDLKDQGYSYAKIADKLDLNSRDTARNYYKTANKLIEQGIGWYDDSR